MLELLSSNPFFMPIYELDGRALDGWNIFQSLALGSASRHENIFFANGIIVNPTIYYHELIADRPMGISAIKQQIALQNMMICIDPLAARAIFATV